MVATSTGADSVAVLGSNHTTNEENYLLQKFARTVLGNPHSESGPSLASTEWLNAMRQRVLRFLDADGGELVTENPGETDISGRVRTLPFGRSISDGRVLAYHVCFNAAADEHFVGFPDRPDDERGSHDGLGIRRAQADVRAGGRGEPGSASVSTPARIQAG